MPSAQTAQREIPFGPGARILVINVARIGDTILATPLLRALKTAQPNTHLTCVAHPGRAEILKNLDFIDELQPFTKKSAWLRGRTGKRWDAAFVLGHDAALLRFALRTSRRVIAFRQHDDELNKALYVTVEKPAAPMHAVKERLLLADAVGISSADLRLAYRPTAAEREQAAHWLAAHVPADAAPIIGIQMGSFPTKAYRDWPVENFIALAKRIAAEKPNAYFVILGGKDVSDRAEEFKRALPGRSTIDACGRLSLRATAALMNRLDLYLGVDTGPTHIAGALGIPMVALYHCFHPGRLLAPLEHQGPLAVIEHPLTGDACERTSPMSLITVENVWQAVDNVIGKPAAS
ncbi:MAG: glycosyltransferase family 9 protein [Gammaproteobacteria bacterium]